MACTTSIFGAHFCPSDASHPRWPASGSCPLGRPTRAPILSGHIESIVTAARPLSLRSPSGRLPSLFPPFGNVCVLLISPEYFATTWSTPSLAALLTLPPMPAIPTARPGEDLFSSWWKSYASLKT
ncbi:putative THP32A9.11c [Fusarium oxysporum f. sp. albedinis]|nr:putative THP32A9.11c [Fusarium oxysporum f. sp. albedinis]